MKSEINTMSPSHEKIDDTIENLKQELDKILAIQRSHQPIQTLQQPFPPIPKYELIGAYVNFMTYSNAKEMSSILQYELKKIDNFQIAFGMDSGNYFPQNYLSPNLGLNIQNALLRSEIFEILFSITMNGSTGNDVWNYQPIITLMFDDGTVLTKKFPIDNIKEGQTHKFNF